MDFLKIPDSSIGRLSLYLRVVKDIEKKGKERVLSKELAEETGFKSPQVRRDLAYFGQFGVRGKGYKVKVLRENLEKILGLDKKWLVSLVGAGNLGAALLAYPGFKKQGFEIACVFDNDIRKIGKTWEGVRIQDISELEKTVKDKNIKMAIITVPAEAAQRVCDSLTRAGIKAILNFAPAKLSVPQGVKLLNVDLSIRLEGLAHFLKEMEK